jgi:hypothetical protein
MDVDVDDAVEGLGLRAGGGCEEGGADEKSELGSSHIKS